MVAQFDRGAFARIRASLDAALGDAPRPVALHEPELGPLEQALLHECIASRQVSSAGTFVEQFEAALASYTGAPAVVATSSGTAALHAALILVGVGRGDEVLVPSLTYVATANAASYCGATPHFIDTDPATLAPDTSKLETYLTRICTTATGHLVNRASGRRIAAVIALHPFGHAVPLEQLSQLCERWHLPLVEDAAQAIGSWHAPSPSGRRRHAGTTGTIAIVSFNGNKTITTGGGGALLTGDAELAREAAHLTSTARCAHPWRIEHDRIGFNYRMPSLNAALGCAQLRVLPELLERKRRLARRYQAAFAGVDGARIVSEPEGAVSNYWLNLLALESANPPARDALLAEFHRDGILARAAWTPLHTLEMHATCPRMDLSGAEELYGRLIALPGSPRLVPAGSAC